MIACRSVTLEESVGFGFYTVLLKLASLSWSNMVAGLACHESRRKVKRKSGSMRDSISMIRFLRFINGAPLSIILSGDNVLVSNQEK